MNPPICKSCRFCVKEVTGAFTQPIHHCRSPELGYDLVTGNAIFKLCRDMRGDPNQCGRDGKWYTQKDQLND